MAHATRLFQAGLALALLLLSGCVPDHPYESALLLADFAAGSGPSRLKTQTPVPRRESLRITIRDRSYQADLYTSGEKPMAPLLIVPGAAESGKDDPRLVAFATSLARVRFAVLVPDLPGLRRLQVSTANIQEVADVFSWLLARPELAPAGRGGMVAFSYGAGPALLAARQPELRERAAFLLLVGGYYDLPAALTYFTTGWYRQEGEWRHQEPNAYGKWVFVQANLERVTDARDRELLRTIAERKMSNLQAPVTDLAARLGPEGRALYAFLTNRDPRRTPLLLRELPAAIREEIAALDLATRDLSHLTARLLLVHGYDDPIIPFTQSVELARAAPDTELFLLRGLYHVDLRPGWVDRWRLWQLTGSLLGRRDELATQAAPLRSP